MAQTVVYFPNLAPPARWTKEAALCWERIEIPAPPTYVDSPKPYVKGGPLEALDEALPDLLHLVEWRHLSKSAERQFGEWLAANPEHPIGSSEPWSDDPWWRLFDEKFRPDRQLLVRLAELRLADISPEEIRPRDSSLVRERLAMHRLVSVRRRVAQMYIALCASERATETGADMVSDDESYTEPIFYSRSVMRADITKTVLQSYVPRDIDSVGLSQLLEARESLRLARRQYTAEIDELAARHASGLSSETDLRRLKDDLVELSRQRVDDTKRCYRAANLDLVQKGLGVALAPPALGTWLSSALHMGIFEPTGLGAAAVLFGMKLLSDAKATRREKEASPWSYVIRVAEQLG